MISPLNDLPEAIIILDSENQIIGVNQHGEALLKIKQIDLIGKSIDVIFPSQSSLSSQDEYFSEEREEISFCRSDGQIVFVELTISTIDGLNGDYLGRVVIIRENTQSGEMSAAQEQSLRNQNLMLRALQETTFDLHSSLDLNIVLRNIVERACKLLETAHGYLDILRETGELEPVVGIGALARVAQV